MRPVRSIVGILSLFIVSVFPGCATLFNAGAPMDQLDYTQPKQHHDTLLVLLPGMGDDAQDFEKHGFIEAVRDRRLPIDVVAVDAHFAYYARRTLIERLHTDVIQPARQHGYRHIWLAGISLGGLGALLYTQAHPADIDGVLLLAPYLGNAGLFREIQKKMAASGGAPALRNGQADEDATNPFRALWDWLAARAQQPDTAQPPLILAFGSDDRLVTGLRLMAKLLPPQRVIEMPGRHDWPTWQRLWVHLLEQHPFARRGLAPNKIVKF